MTAGIEERVVTLKSHRWILSTDAEVLLQRFFVTSAATFIGVRIFLALTGYPQLGGHGLHVAHLLWGGLLMMASLVVLFAFIGRDLRLVWVVAAGIGWGLFIDELGKFITSDVNYFYKPAVPLIYATFVLLYIVFREIIQATKTTDRGRVARAMEIAQTGIMRGLTEGDRQRLDELLATAGPDQPIAQMLRALVDNQETVLNGKTRQVVLVERLGDAYRKISQSKVFVTIVILIAVGAAATQFAELASEIVRSGLYSKSHNARSWFNVLKGASTFLSTGFILLGAFQVRRSRIKGLRLMQTGILIGLLLCQVFAFYTLQILALWGLAYHLIALAVVNYALTQEIALAEERGAHPTAPISIK